MSTQREELETLIADVIAEHFERLRADVMEKMLRLRTPRFSITPKGELYVDGELVGDVRPVFRAAVTQALQAATPNGDDDAGTS
jgi:hypothetical protein